MAATCQASARITAKQSRRRHSPRGARQRMEFDSAELAELVMASKLVPTGDRSNKNVDIPARRQFLDADALSTAAPSSTEHSPELPCMASNLEAWPALRKAECDWELCDESVDAEEVWEDLPEPALALEGFGAPEAMPQSTVSWWVVSGNDSTDPSTLKTSVLAEGQEVTSTATFADLLRDHQGVQAPPACGAPMPPLHRSSGASMAQPQRVVAAKTDEPSELPDPCWHGWKKDKASWNTKQRLKVAHSKEQKQRQSQHSRKLMDDEDSLQNEA